jgi:hypothetical protein
MRLSDYDPKLLKSLPSHDLATSDFVQTWKKSIDVAIDALQHHRGNW